MKRFLPIAMSVAILFSLVACNNTAESNPTFDIGDGNAAWMTPNGSYYHSGTAPFSPAPPFGVTWENQLPNTTRFSPITASELLFISDDAGNVYCLDQKNGSSVWSRNLGEKGFQPVLSTRYLFIGAEGGRLLACNPVNGKTVWEAKLDGDLVGYPIIDPGMVWVVTEHDLYGFEETKGTEVFHKNFGDMIFTQPPAFQKYLYLVAGNQLLAFNELDKKVVWRKYFENVLIGPVVCQRSSIYAVDSRLFKLNDEGEVLDTYTHYPANPSGEILEGDEWGKIRNKVSIFTNVICFPTEYGSIVAIRDSNNGLDFLWSLGVTLPPKAPVVVGVDYVYFGASDGRFYVCSTKDGKWIWHNRFGEREDIEDQQFYSTPAVLDNRVFVVSESGLIKRMDVGGRPMSFDEMSE